MPPRRSLSTAKITRLLCGWGSNVRGRGAEGQEPGPAPPASACSPDKILPAIRVVPGPAFAASQPEADPLAASARHAPALGVQAFRFPALRGHNGPIAMVDVVFVVMGLEWWLSRRHERALRGAGAIEPSGDVYGWMRVTSLRCPRRRVRRDGAGAPRARHGPPVGGGVRTAAGEARGGGRTDPRATAGHDAENHGTRRRGGPGSAAGKRRRAPRDGRRRRRGRRASVAAEPARVRAVRGTHRRHHLAAGTLPRRRAGPGRPAVLHVEDRLACAPGAPRPAASLRRQHLPPRAEHARVLGRVAGLCRDRRAALVGRRAAHRRLQPGRAVGLRAVGVHVLSSREATDGRRGGGHRGGGGVCVHAVPVRPLQPGRAADGRVDPARPAGAASRRGAPAPARRPAATCPRPTTRRADVPAFGARTPAARRRRTRRCAPRTRRRRRWSRWR